jgi:hypothetical protein
MKTPPRRRAFASYIAALCGASAWFIAPSAKALAVYHIGNSLVLQNEQRAVIQALAIEAGHDQTYSMSVILGAPLSYIWSNPDASGGWEGQVYPLGLAASRSWDALVLEPYDRNFHDYPYDDPSAPGYAENDVLNADHFYQLALAGNPQNQLYIYEIFPMKSGWTAVPEQRTLAHATTIAEQLSKLHPSAAPVKIIPAGDVIQKLGALADQGQLPHISAHTALYGDEDHLNEVGSYAVALAHLACLYGDDPHVYSNRPVYPASSGYAPGTAIWRDAAEYHLLAPLGGAVWPETAAVIKDVVAQVTANTPRSGLDGGVRIATASLPPAVVGQSYSAALTGTLGQAPYTWSITSGALPSGLRLEGNTIVGVPTVATNAAFTLQLSDSSSPARKVSQSFTIAVSAADATFSIPAATLASATRGTRFAQALVATGGVPPIQWTLESGRLPIGVTLGADGTLQGPPGEEGSFAFAVVATDSTPGAARTAHQTFNLVVAPLGPATVVASKRPAACPASASLLNRLPLNLAAKAVGTTDNQVHFAAEWDPQFLRIVVQVRDAKIVEAGDAVSTRGDAVDIYVNADDGKGTIYGARDRRIVVGAKGERWLPDGRDTGIVSTTGGLADGYAVELAIPWSNLGITPQANITLGFDVANLDDDGAGRVGALYWYGGADDASRPSAWGNLLLGAASSNDGGTCSADAQDAGSADATGGRRDASPDGGSVPAEDGSAMEPADGGTASVEASRTADASPESADASGTMDAAVPSSDAGDDSGVALEAGGSSCQIAVIGAQGKQTPWAAGLLLGASWFFGVRRRRAEARRG